MSYRPIDTKELAEYLLKHINMNVPEKLLHKAQILKINLEPVIELSMERHINDEEIVQLIDKECKKKELLIYNNLLDNYPILPIGIRDCYKKSM